MSYDLCQRHTQNDYQELFETIWHLEDVHRELVDQIHTLIQRIDGKPIQSET